MTVYCLTAQSTDMRETGVRYREYTTSRRRAEAFAAIPPIQFTDSGHRIIFSMVLHSGRREPPVRTLRASVDAALAHLSRRST